MEDNNASNLYRAPEADVTPAGQEAAPFYVVSPFKLTLLFWITMGIYDLYWHYKNWALYREARGGGGLPVMRALFSIFFAPSLFQRMSKEAREAGVTGGTPAVLLSVVYVFFTLISNFTYMAQGSGPEALLVQLLSMGCMIPIWWVLWRAQKRVNATLGDAAGENNHRLTRANWIWIVLGGLLWLATLLSLVVWVASLAGVVDG
ncbi:hypothetical protein ACLD02_05155 [Alloalcanivorax sp. C16-2]|uniref:hypothetical protein n=1 Tax=Alloalcanivorax sp. C16-2 TaxID=3390052 RepID=UPI0039710B98